LVVAAVKDPVEVKVTRIKGVGWGILITIYGKEWSKRAVKTRKEIHPSIEDDLRLIDKCCNPSPMASASRDRRTAKRVTKR
jgi:hypothetical protein